MEGWAVNENPDYDPKAKYALHYATDLTTAPGSGPSKMVSFRSRLGFFWFLARNKDARDAVRAERFRFFVITKDKP